MNKLDYKIIISAIVSIAVIGAIGMYYAISVEEQNPVSRFELITIEMPPTPITDTVTIEGTDELRKFSSESEVKEFLKTFTQRIELETAFKYPRPTLQSFMEPVNLRESGVWNSGEPVPAPPSASPIHTGAVSLGRTAYPVPFDSDQNQDSKADYSTTNVQVKAVDEPDYLKTDGIYVYMVYEKILTIIQAHPADDAKVLTKISLDIESQNLQNMFLNDDRLVIFYHDSDYEETIPLFEIEPQRIYKPRTHALIVDVSDREEPHMVQDYSVDGRFFDARMIGNHVYFVTVDGVNHHHPTVPRILDGAQTVMVPEVFYFDSFEPNYNFNTITAIDLSENSENINSETFLMGGAGAIYVSETGFYITYQKNIHPAYYGIFKKNTFFDVIVPMLPKEIQSKITAIESDSALDWNQKWNAISDILIQAFNIMQQSEKEKLVSEIQKQVYMYQAKARQSLQTTIVHKILLDGNDLEYKAKGEIPGRLLNQFSMDEDGDRFRVATTYEHYTYEQGTRQYNAVYVLDENLSIVGSIDGIAPDESIFSARFMGDRLYLVTFEQIDPFFVIDLSTDTPKILGELKIPGFSNYLHPYDEDHIIGLGRHTEETKNGGVRQLGVKIALFDVSDVKNPRVLDEVIFVNRDSNSEAAHDHKAFLFDKRNGILSIPIDQRERIKTSSGTTTEYWYGFYVYKLDTINGFDPQGKIKHYDSHDSINRHIKPRSFYINDILYTVSSKAIKMNDLNDIGTEINSINLGPTGQFMKTLK